MKKYQITYSCEFGIAVATIKALTKAIARKEANRKYKNVISVERI